MGTTSKESIADAINRLTEGLEPEALDLWLLIGNRIYQGQLDYGGFNFEGKDLDREAMEELMDWVVYTAAKHYLKGRKEGTSGDSSGEAADD